MRKYELTVIFDGRISTEDLEKGIVKVEKILKEAKSEIEKTDKIGKRKLAYPILKVNEGTYCIYYFSNESKAILDIDKKIRLTENILRYLIVNTEDRG